MLEWGLLWLASRELLMGLAFPLLMYKLSPPGWWIRSQKRFSCLSLARMHALILHVCSHFGSCARERGERDVTVRSPRGWQRRP